MYRSVDAMVRNYFKQQSVMKRTIRLIIETPVPTAEAFRSMRTLDQLLTKLKANRS